MDEIDINDYKQILEFVNKNFPKRGEANLRGDKLVKKSKDFFTALGNPQNNYKVVHVAGTMGKGTVVHLVEALLRAHGFKTGMTISPHVFSMRERIQVNGQLISKPDYIRLIKQIYKQVRAVADAQGKMSYYESNILVASMYFYEQKIDYAVIETGLGGMYDMTNQFNPSKKMAVLTKIGLDHTAVLGSTIEEIAVQKAGIIQEGNQVITFTQSDSIIDQFQKATESQHAKMTIIPSENGVNGHYHLDNLNLAVETVKQLAERDDWSFNETLAQEVIDKLVIPGRAQKFTFAGREYIFDGAHNPEKATGLVSVLRKEHPKRKYVVVMALKKAKDARGVIEALAPVTNRFIFTTFLASQDISSMSQSPQGLTKIATDLGVDAVATSNARQAVAQLAETNDTVLITGSNYLIGEAYELVAASD
jgi:dihydrofolate synthase/folylpolyglutamate synthase